MRRLCGFVFILLVLFAWTRPAWTQELEAQIPLKESGIVRGAINSFIAFDGQWAPDLDSALIGGRNYKTLQNLRYKDGGIEETDGYSKITSSIISETYVKPRSGYHFRKDRPQESHLLLQSYNHDLSRSAVFDNQTEPPNTGNFGSTYLHLDEAYSEATGGYPQYLLFNVVSGTSEPISGVTTGVFRHQNISARWANAITVASTITYSTSRARFAPAANGQVVYTNATESQIWGGNEMSVASCVVAESEVTEFVKVGRDYTVQVSNGFTTSAESANVVGRDGGVTSYMVIGTTRPISGATLYVGADAGNSHANKRLQAYYWSGVTWANLNITDGTSALAQTGKVTFPSTVDTAKPKLLNDNVLYYYQLHVYGTGASVYQVGVDCPWQNLVDTWDSVYRTPVGFYVTRENNETYDNDYTYEVNQISSSLYPIGAEMGGLNMNKDAVAVFEDRCRAMRIEVLTGNTNPVGLDSGVTVSTWTGTTWYEVPVQWDGTCVEQKPFSKSGYITWEPPDEEEEFVRTAFSIPGYAYRLMWNGVLGAAGALNDFVIVDAVYGVPAAIKLKNFKFPAFYKNRTLLCGYLKGNEPHRVDYSLPNAPDVWNGTDTSDNGRQSLYIGNGEELMAAVEVFNRFGSEMDTYEVFLTKSSTYLLTGDGPGDPNNPFRVHTISESVGCPAPFTVARAEIAHELIPGELQRNTVFWLSATNPVLFDGAVIQPIHGIDCYFDQQDSRYVGSSEIASAFGWYDRMHKEYNLRVADYWFAYDMVRRRWFQKDTGTAEAVRCAFSVLDSDGGPYVYGGIDTGHLMRLEDGADWDGIEIDRILETGDFFLDGDGWHENNLRRLKLAYRENAVGATAFLGQHYGEGETAASQMFLTDIETGSGVSRYTISPNETAWLHRFKFSWVGDLKPLGMGYQAMPLREDH